MAPEVAPIEQSRLLRFVKIAGRILAALFVTFVFLTSVKILGTGFEMFGEGGDDFLYRASSLRIWRRRQGIGRWHRADNKGW